MFPRSGVELCLGAGIVQGRQMNRKGGCSLEDGGGRAQGRLGNTGHRLVQRGKSAGGAQNETASVCRGVLQRSTEEVPKNEQWRVPAQREVEIRGSAVCSTGAARGSGRRSGQETAETPGRGRVSEEKRAIKSCRSLLICVLLLL